MDGNAGILPAAVKIAAPPDVQALFSLYLKRMQTGCQGRDVASCHPVCLFASTTQRQNCHAELQITSSPSRDGKAGKGAVGSVWYQKTVEAMSSCKGR